MWAIYARSGHFDVDKPIAQYSAAERDLLLYATEGKVPLAWQGGSINMSYEGAVAKFRRLFIEATPPSCRSARGRWASASPRR